jgi:hypothetical protein
MQDMATSDNTPKDVDREIVLAFNINDETSSFLIRKNLKSFFPSLPSAQYYNLLQLPSFQAPHNYHAINGEKRLPHIKVPGIGFCLDSIAALNFMMWIQD